jgi:excisionase family DNA binding protein
MEAQQMAKASITKKRRQSTPPVPPDARAISMAQAARVSGLSERTLYNRIASGELKALRTGNRTLIAVVELDRFLGIRA